MTAPTPPAPKPKPTFFRRRFAPLFTAWAVALSIAGFIYWFERSMPAFHEVVGPLYWIIATIMLIGTWRWIRTRGRPAHDRREADRRHTDRRDQSISEPPDAPVT